MKKDFPKVFSPKIIKYGKIFPIFPKPRVTFHASLKFSEPPWHGKYLSAKISKISENDLKNLREIRDAIISQKIIERWQTSFKLLQNGIIFAKFEKGEKIWIGDDLADPPLDHEMRGKIRIVFEHVFIGDPHKSISCVLESFSC